jgi:Abortive infection bacteriophage resistance protein
MTKTPFNKQALTPEKLLAKYQAQGLIVDANQIDLALNYFRYVGAYRLKGYLHHFIDSTTKQLPADFTLAHLIQQYECDRELRALTIDAVDRIEVAVRSVMANYLSLKYSPHWFLSSDIFSSSAHWTFGQLIRKIETDVQQAKDKHFIEHYFKHYDSPHLPPSWAISECVSFGFWSKTYEILHYPQDKKAISMKFNIDQPEVFRSWIHTLTVVRNLAAHHSQLLRIKLRIKPVNYKSHAIRFSPSDSFGAASTVIQFLLNQVQSHNTWQNDLQALKQKYPLVNPSDYGL